MNEVTQYHDDDDGYGGSLTSGRLIKGQLLRWNETNGWIDRDGLQPPEILLAIALSEALQTPDFGWSIHFAKGLFR
jgi:hypothetical protein